MTAELDGIDYLTDRTQYKIDEFLKKSSDEQLAEIDKFKSDSEKKKIDVFFNIDLTDTEWDAVSKAASNTSIIDIFTLPIITKSLRQDKTTPEPTELDGFFHILMLDPFNKGKHTIHFKIRSDSEGIVQCLAVKHTKELNIVDISNNASVVIPAAITAELKFDVFLEPKNASASGASTSEGTTETRLVVKNLTTQIRSGG